MPSLDDLVVDQPKEPHRSQSSRRAGTGCDVVHLQHGSMHRQLVLGDTRRGLENPLDRQPALVVPESDHRTDVGRQ
jgi:hypothetical protein